MVLLRLDLLCYNECSYVNQFKHAFNQSKDTSVQIFNNIGQCLFVAVF